MKFLILTAIFYSLVLNGISYAAPVALDRNVSAVVGILKLVQNISDQVVRIPVVCNSRNDESKKETMAFLNQLEIYDEKTKRTFQFYKVEEGKMATLENVRAIILTNGVSQKGQRFVEENFSKKGVVTLSMDLDCVKNDSCLVGLSTNKSPADVLINSELLSKSNIVFDPVFMFVARKI